MPQGATRNTLVATYNDVANVEELIKDGDVAAVILEPVVGNSGYIAPTKVWPPPNNAPPAPEPRLPSDGRS